MNNDNLWAKSHYILNVIIRCDALTKMNGAIIVHPASMKKANVATTVGVKILHQMLSRRKEVHTLVHECLSRKALMRLCSSRRTMLSNLKRRSIHAAFTCG